MNISSQLMKSMLNMEKCSTIYPRKIWESIVFVNRAKALADATHMPITSDILQINLLSLYCSDYSKGKKACLLPTLVARERQGVL